MSADRKLWSLLARADEFREDASQHGLAVAIVLIPSESDRVDPKTSACLASTMGQCLQLATILEVEAKRIREGHVAGHCSQCSPVHPEAA
jgi:hypothetical protein